MKWKASNWPTFLCCLLLWVLLLSCDKDNITPEGEKKGPDFGDTWVDPAFNDQFEGKNIVVWFKEQFLESPEAYFSRQSEFTSRTIMRETVMTQLKALSHASHEKAQSTLDSMVTNNLISDLKKHWIIHGTVVAGIISGRIASDTVIGLAPNARRTPIRGLLNQESMIEWAVEQFTHTFRRSGIDALGYQENTGGNFKRHWLARI